MSYDIRSIMSTAWAIKSKSFQHIKKGGPGRLGPAPRASNRLHAAWGCGSERAWRRGQVSARGPWRPLEGGAPSARWSPRSEVGAGLGFQDPGSIRRPAEQVARSVLVLPFADVPDLRAAAPTQVSQCMKYSAPGHRR